MPSCTILKDVRLAWYTTVRFLPSRCSLLLEDCTLNFNNHLVIYWLASKIIWYDSFKRIPWYALTPMWPMPGYNQVGVVFATLSEDTPLNALYTGRFLRSVSVSERPFSRIWFILNGLIQNRMRTFDQRMGQAVADTNKKGWLVSILELGAWFGVLMTGTSLIELMCKGVSSVKIGYFADKLSRKYTIVLGNSL